MEGKFMFKYIIRLDDASEKRDIEKWNRVEELLNKYQIKPIVGIIPNCKDPDMERFPKDENFWERAREWQKKGWIIALHGDTHVFASKEGGINPVNCYSEFAGVPLEVQKNKIAEGIGTLSKNGLYPKIFFAPAHTFDCNTIEALKSCSDIRIVSDTVAFDTYLGNDGMTYIPQQSGRVRRLPFRTVTFCYHPNTMNDVSFDELEHFIVKYRRNFKDVEIIQSKRKYGFIDKCLSALYFARR